MVLSTSVIVFEFSPFLQIIPQQAHIDAEILPSSIVVALGGAASIGNLPLEVLVITKYS
jgi:hypothetical protein